MFGVIVPCSAIGGICNGIWVGKGLLDLAVIYHFISNVVTQWYVIYPGPMRSLKDNFELVIRVVLKK